MEQHAGTGVEHCEASDASQRRPDAHRAGCYEQYRPAHGRDEECDPVGCQNSATILDQGFYAARWY
jgi:hypothetical protein